MPAANDNDGIDGSFPFDPVTPPALDGNGAPAPAHLGLLLEADEREFRIALLARDGERLVVLGPYGDAEIGEAWRSLAAASGLRMLHRDPAGLVVELGSRAAVAIHRPPADRKRLRVLTGRRPRFLVRRKPGVVPSRPARPAERDAPVSGR